MSLEEHYQATKFIPEWEIGMGKLQIVCHGGEHTHTDSQPSGLDNITDCIIDKAKAKGINLYPTFGMRYRSCEGETLYLTFTFDRAAQNIAKNIAKQLEQEVSEIIVTREHLYFDKKSMLWVP